MSLPPNWETPYALPVDWTAVGKELKARPGEWRHVATYFGGNSGRSTAYQIRTGRNRSLAAIGTFDARFEMVDGEPRVYVRYLGDAL